MDKIVQEQIKFKMEEIDRLFSEYEQVFNRINNKEPDLFDITVLGSILHSFYNGLENIFELIAKNIDNKIPSGNKSHQELLQQMFNKNDYRDSILNEKLYMKLKEYATFRHFFRHSYSFQLKWDKMKPLIDNLFDIWNEIKISLDNFIKNNISTNKKTETT